MTWTQIASAFGVSDASATTVDISTSFNLQAHDSVVFIAKWEGGAATASAAKNTGSPANTATFNAGDNFTFAGAGDAYQAIGYVLDAAADATATFRLTLSVARTYIRFIAIQFRPTAGSTVTQIATNHGSGSGTAVASGNVTTSGTDCVVVAGYGEYGSTTTSSEQFNGVARDGRMDTGTNASVGYWASAWWKFVTTAVTGQATATITSNPWGCSVIVLKATAGGGGGGGTDAVLAFSEAA